LRAGNRVARSWAVGYALLRCLNAVAAPTASYTSSDPYPTAARSYLLTRDQQPLWQHAAQARLPAASLVKLLTALVVLDGTWSEDDWSNDKWLSVSSAAASIAPSRIGLRAGEQARAGATLAAMLIHSANDACLTLVENTALTQQQFVARMNQYANRLDMHDSHFVDPCGFDTADQYSTAADLLKLAQAAYQHKLIATLVATPRASLTTKAGREIAFVTTNQLLGRLTGTIGMKTGYTQQAGQCLIAVVRRDDHEVWLVMLGSRQRWWQAHKMIEDAFADIHTAP
jgi:serine-type D-Ala-D-Ala carboxypeptidase (penicillin-binding protein 5/6)